MSKKFGARFAVAVATAGLATAMVAFGAGAAVTATLTGDLTYSGTTYAGVNASFGGSTFDEPFLDAAIPVYLTQATNKSGASAVPTGLPLYDGVGSSAGKKGVENGTFQVGFTDVPLGTVTGINHNVNLDTLAGTSPATTLSSYTQVPIVLGGVAVAVNFPHSVTKAWPKGQTLILDATTIAKIYTGGITKWNDAAIKALNPKLVKTTIKKNKAGKVISRHTTSLLPNLAITPVYRADGSGTSFAFESYLNQAAPSVFAGSSAITATTAWPGTSWPSGLLSSSAVGAQKSAGVAYDVSQTSGGIGYMEDAYVSQNNLLAAKVVNKSGHAEALSPTTVAADALSFTLPSENANGQVSNFDIANGTAANAYPISTYSWAVVPSDFKQIGLAADGSGSTGGVNAETVVAKFLDWAVQLGGGQALSKKEGYVPMPGPVTTLAEQQIATLTFGGAGLGLN